MGSQIWKPVHLKTNLNGPHLIFTIYNLDYLFWILDAILDIYRYKIILQKFQITNSQFSDPNCVYSKLVLPYFFYSKEPQTKSNIFAEPLQAKKVTL